MSFKNELSKELRSSCAVRLLASVEGMLSRKSRLKSVVCPVKEDVLWRDGNECCEAFPFWLCIGPFCDIMEFCCMGLLCACIGPWPCMGPFCIGLPWWPPMPPMPLCCIDMLCDWLMCIFGICGNV